MLPGQHVNTLNLNPQISASGHPPPDESRLKASPIQRSNSNIESCIGMRHPAISQLFRIDNSARPNSGAAVMWPISTAIFRQKVFCSTNRHTFHVHNPGSSRLMPPRDAPQQHESCCTDIHSAPHSAGTANNLKQNPYNAVPQRVHRIEPFFFTLQPDGKTSLNNS